MKKIFVALILMFVIFQNAYVQQNSQEHSPEEIAEILTTYGEDLDQYEFYNEDYLNVLADFGDEVQSNLALQILDLRKKRKEIKDKLDELDSKKNKFTACILFFTGLNKQTKKDIDQLNQDLDDLYEQEEQAIKAVIQYTNDKKAAAKAQAKGDPVKITTGSYRQDETDFESGNNLPVTVSRVYDSSCTVYSSFGYGWSTNLDERILLGIEPQAQAQILQDFTYITKVTSAEVKLKALVQLEFGITDFETGYDQLEQELDSLSDEYLAAAKQAKLYHFDDLEKTAGKGAQSVHSIKPSLLQSFTEQMEHLDQFDTLKEQAVQKKDECSQKLEENQKRQEQNQKAFFPGMDQTLIETGINTIILIDSNGNPNILYQTDSNTWETQGGKEKLYCIKSNGQYTITFFDGTVKQYDSNGFIKKITDRNNNHIIFNRNTDESIKTIESSSGEKLSFCYDGPYIKSITNMRDPLQKTEYSYSNGRLTSVTDTDGDTLTMVYDSKGHMTCVKKSDGSNVSFVYGQTDSQGNALTTQTTNEEGFSEFFIYDPAAKKTIYKDHDGNESVTEYNSNHLTVRETKPDGSTTEYKYDDSNNLIQTNTNGDITKFSYDERGNKTNVLYSDGSTEEYGYDTFGLIVLFRDSDNFLYEYIRDNRGNITEYKENGKTACLQEFDDKGSLIKQTVHQDKTTVTEYEYDRFGNCILKKEGTAISKYEYDTRNRITKIIQNDQTISSYKYEKKKIVQTDYNGLETTYIINDRKDITRIIQKDTVTGVVHQLQIEYDKRHLPLRVFAGDEKNQKLVASCTYTNEGKLKTQVYHGDETFITAYTFERGALKSVSQFIQGQDPFLWEYNFKNKPENKKLLTITNPLGDSSLFDFDASGNLVCHTDENGETTQNIWSPAGRLKEFQISYGGFYNYDEYIKNDTNNVLYEYDCFGRITKQTVVNPQNPSEAVYFVTNEYASDGRSVTVTEGGKYKTVCELDAFGNIIKETDGNGNSRLYEYDFQNQLIAAYDGYMNKTSYEYNALGYIKSITLADGSKTNYEYNALGQIIKITDDCGVLYTAEYDKAGRLIKEKTRADSEQAYEYDKAGRLTKVLCGKQIVEAYSYGPRGRTVTVTDGNGSEYFYNYDSFGRCISETNRLGFTQEFPYDNEDDLMGESVISYDAAGNIIEIKNENGQTKYEYDKGGRLILQKDITSGEEIHFEYDSAGNRTHLYSSNRETFYTYGANNEIKEFFDNKQRVRVQLEYNKIGREILRKFANGTTEHACYDKAGRLTLKYQKNSQGELLWGEGYLYSADGKRTATVDNKALVTLYEYDSQGRLSSVYYPCADGNGVNKFLSSNEKSELSLLLNQMNYTLAFSLTTMQVFKKKSYTYDKNGNLISKKTPQETIEYSYDKENRLISSSTRGQILVNYTYDKSGNLLKEESDQKVTNCRYNQQNRLIYCEVTDKTTARCTQTKYAYDALGRRIMVQDFDEPPLHTIYDGFTFDVIKQSPSYANGTLTDTYETGIRWGMTGQATGDRYRYIDDQSRKTSSDRYQKERTQFSVNDTIAAQVSYGGKTEYFSTDILGSVRSTTNMYGQQTQALSYDAYGSLLTGDLSGTTDFGYLGKQLDPTTKAYNYGFRDYTPNTARFTTTDPLRDGPNWFTYCNGDPVNFKDLWGLCKVSDREIILNDQEKITLAAGYMILPIQEGFFSISSPYGKRDPITINGVKSKDFHNGTDFAAKTGTPVRAVAKGQIIDTGYSEIFGKYIEIRHTPTTTTFYAHLDTVNIKLGDIVEGGEKIGTVGSTGYSTGPHLHFEVRVNNIAVNPHF